MEKIVDFREEGKMKSENIAEIAKALREFEIPPRFEPSESRLLIQALRLIADGLPVSPQKIEQISSNIKIPYSGAKVLLNRFSEHDDEGNIVGLLGLSQKSHPHRFEVKGHSFTTWCAWDSLFLPALLKNTARVESFCPATKMKIKLTITPEKVERVEPNSTVISMALPEKTTRASGVVEEIWSNFCCLVHFISSTEVAAEWISGQDQNLKILSVEEGYRLGQLAFEELHKYL